MAEQIVLHQEVPEELSGKRLDQVAARLFPQYSRSRLQDWIKSGQLLSNGQLLRIRDKVFADDVLSIDAELEYANTHEAEALPLDIVFEDSEILIVNKAVNTVVHPAAGHSSGTLLNGLLHYAPQLATLPRAGIVHRLDKDTSGLMVVAKTLPAHNSLVRQLHRRTVSRRYQAVVQGCLTAGGTIEEPLGRHPVNRKKRAVREGGQEAITHFTVIRRFPAHSHIQVQLETGRTHQIRVHMSHLGYPLVGDKTYGGRQRVPGGCSEPLAEALRQFPRQALHATSLGLFHPQTQAAMEWECAIPDDMQRLLQSLETG